MTDTPRTDALWLKLSRHGWGRDNFPVSYIMESHDELEKELAEASKDYRCLAELLDGHDATECRANLVNLKRRIDSSERARRSLSDAADYLNARLASERALADRLAKELEQATNYIDYETEYWPDDSHLAAWKAARDEQKP